MANANSMGGLCISFDTECRNSLSLKGLKRVLDNELIYDINKSNVDYLNEIKKQFKKIIQVTKSDGTEVKAQEDEKTIIKFNDDWIVGVTDTDMGIDLNIISRKESALYLTSGLCDKTGLEARSRGNPLLNGWTGQLYREYKEFNDDNNCVGGHAGVANPQNVSYLNGDPNSFVYAYMGLNKIIGKDEDGYNKYKETRIYVITTGEHKGEFFYTLEEAVSVYES